jgi:hypothetical protein
MVSVSNQIVMPVLAHQSTFNALGDSRVIFSHSGDINEKPSISINPPGINDIQLVFYSSNFVVWIDLEQVVSSFGDMGKLVVEFGHVVVASKEVYCTFVYLDIEIGVPG